MIDREHELPLVRQAVLVGLSRGAIYYEPRPLPEADLQLMKRMDELHLEHPFAGSRMLRDLLNREGHDVAQARRHADAPHGDRCQRRLNFDPLQLKNAEVILPPLGTYH